MTHAELLKEWLRGDADAISLILTLHEIAETWDDLIDKDKPVPDSAVNHAFYKALVTLPRNPFYARNFTLLNPVLESAILDWLTANDLEARKEGDDLHMAYALRCASQAVTVLCARIIGGLEWARHVNLKLRSMGDSWADYSKEFGGV